MNENGSQALDHLVGACINLILTFLKGLVLGIWQGIRKLDTWKKRGLFLLTFLVTAAVWLLWDTLLLLFAKTSMPGYLSKTLCFFLLGFPCWFLWILGQGKSQKCFEAAFQEIGFCSREKKYPIYCGSGKDGKKTILIFKSGIPLNEWHSARDRLETALDCNILKLENGSNKRIVKLTTLPSDYRIPTMIEWSEEYLIHKNGVLSVGQSALDTISFDLNRLPHVLIAGETGSGKSVILRCLLRQFILQGGRVYMIDFKGGVEFGKQYERYGEVIMDRERALIVLTMLVRENECRLKIFRDLEVKNLEEYNRKTKKNLCRIGVFTDELAEMLDKKGASKEDKAVFEQLEGKLSTLARLSRATGINLFMGVQRPDANVLTGQIKNNIPVRICGRFADKTASEIVLGNTDAVNLPDIKGRFLYKVGNEIIEFQSYYFDDERMLDEVTVQSGEMLTESGALFPGEPGRPAERDSAKVYPQDRLEEPHHPSKGSWKKKQKTVTEKNSWENMSQKQLEKELQRMDEEDLNLNFDGF